MIENDLVEAIIAVPENMFYNTGIGKAQYSYTSAIGLCLNVINFVIIISVNAISRKVSDISLF